MGLVDKLKGIITWQSAVVIMFYLGAVLAITIIAILYDIVWLIAAGATTLGIVAGSITGVLRQPVAIVNPNETEVIKRLEAIERAQAEQATRLVDLQSAILLQEIEEP